MTRDIIITDVTCYGSLYCVAGWDAVTNRMVRPEPSTTNPMAEASRFWPEQYVGQGRVFSVGNIVRVQGANPQPPADMPHATEDCILAPNSVIEVTGSLAGGALAAAVHGSVRPSLTAAFDNRLVRAASGKCHITAGENVRSLSAIELNTVDIDLYVDTYDAAKPKLRARIRDAGVLYDLSVPAAAQRASWKNDGIVAALNEVRATPRAQVRLGLCRAFGGKGYAQINGFIGV